MIDEVVAQINAGLHSCQLDDGVGVEAALGIEVAFVDAIQIAQSFDIALTQSTCALGGQRDVLCSAGDAVSTRSVNYTDCRDTDAAGGKTLSRTGGLVETVADPSFCSSGVRSPTTPVTLELLNFTQSDGTRTISVSRLQNQIEPTGDGCSEPNGRRAFDGMLRVTGGDAEADYHYEAVSVDLQSGDTPCTANATIAGTVDVDDRAHGARFSAVAENFVLTTQRSAEAQLRLESGQLTALCVGAARFEVMEPLFLRNDAACPSGGLLQITLLADGTKGRLRFVEPAGVEIDFTSDGQVDKAASTCQDTSLAQCIDPSVEITR